MTSRTIIAIAAALAFSAAPTFAQTSTSDQNAHHYQGGPKTEVPHMMEHPDMGDATKKTGKNGGHHYSGGPKSENHHMGEKK